MIKVWWNITMHKKYLLIFVFIVFLCLVVCNLFKEKNDFIDFMKIKEYCETEMHSGGIEVEVMEECSIPLSVSQKNGVSQIKFPSDSFGIAFKALTSKNQRGAITIIESFDSKSLANDIIFGIYDGIIKQISLSDQFYISKVPLLSPQGNFVVFVAYETDVDEDIVGSYIIAVDMKNNFRQLKIKFADEYIPSLSPCLWQNPDTVTIGHYENDSTSAFWGINIKKLFEGKLY